MADFSSLSYTDDSAVEDLISQTRDLCVLEQVAAINCSGFVDSVLASDLESRFSRLKSFPASTTTAKAEAKPNPRPSHASSARYESDFAPKIRTENEDFSPAKQDPAKKTASKSKPQSGRLSSPPPKRRSASNSSNSSSSSSASGSSPKTANFSSSKRSSDTKKRFVSRSESGSFSSPLSSSKSSRKSPSPPRKLGCFWCSPKKGSARKSKGDWADDDDFGWSKNEKLLADLGSFPIKEQRKILKKAMVEQRKISREAQKIVKLAKQASLAMNVSDIEDKLSDD